MTEQPIPHAFINTGAHQSPPDYRDVDLASVSPIPATLPDSFFLDVSQLPIWMQNKLGACTGHAGAKYLQDVKLVSGKTLVPFSARFPYAMAKCIDGIATDGTYPRLIAQTFQKYGCATEATMPNDTTLDHETYVYQRKLANIPKAALDEAANHKIKSYAFPGTTAAGIQNAIINAGGCMMLVRIGQEWWTNISGVATWDENGILPLRPPKIITSGHEVWVYGYDHFNGRLRIWFLNCWTNTWGHKGAGYFFYDEYAPFINETITFVDLPDAVINHVQQLPPASTFTHNFTKSILYGDNSDEVKALQTALYIDGELKVDPSEFGPFGPKTQVALEAFQIKYAVASLAEIKAVNGKSCGPATRAALNKLFNK